MEKHKRNRGITLIALAITIIILLILTAVTISSVTGNGILFQAHKSTNESNKAEEKNILSASVVYAKSTDNMGNVTKENLQKELDKRADEKYNITEVNNEDGTVYEITFKETKNTYVVTEDGTVKEKDEYDGNTTLDINPKTIPNLKVDGTYEISISGGILNSSNKTINWTSTDENTVSILGDKENTTRVTIRGNAVGSAVIQAKVEVKNNKNVVEKSKTVTCNVNVKERNIVINSVTLTADNTTIDLGTGSNSLQVVAKTKQGKEIEATDLIWKSSNSKIATVNENGTVTGLTNGTTIITATSDTGINGNITITVQTSPKEIKLSKTTVNFDMSGTHTDKLTVTFNPSTTNANNTLTWESNKPGVVSVDNSGNITGISNGDAVITVKTTNGKSATCNVTVKTSPQSISLNKGNTTLDLNGTKTEKLTVTFNPSSTNTNNGLTWRSDNTGIVSVDTSGNITAKSNGTTTITVTTTNGKKATCSVTVKTSPQSISLNNSSLTLDISGTKTSKLNVNFNPTSSNTNNSITWNSDAPGIATVDSSGNVTGVANGTTTIRATTTNGKVATCSVTVQTSPQSISLNKTNVTLDLVGTQNTDLKVTYNPTTSNVQTSITWTSSNPNVASVDSSGNVMGKANGAAVITAETANGKKTTCNVTVHTSLQSISLNKNKLAFDLSTSHKSEKLQITYSPSSANYNNSVTWKSSNTNVARVDQSGTVTAVGNGGATITATAQNGYTAQCSVGVSTSIISLSVSPTSKTLNIGETVQLTGTKNPTSASEGTQWTSSNTSVATVSGSGLVTAKSAGTATITFKNSSSTKSASCTITVLKTIGPNDPNTETDTTFSTEYGLIDIIWLDKNNNIISNPNTPVLSSNNKSLTPVKWNGETEVSTTANDSSWYNYSSRNWANAKTANGSYFVWIPRFAYRITYYSDSNYTNETGYYDGYGQWKKSGELRLKIDSGIKYVKYNNMRYIVHPAFETDLDNGGWSSQLAGFWVSKFYMSNYDDNGLISSPAIAYNYESRFPLEVSIGLAYSYSRSASYGYGITGFMESHMQKNSEYGAMTYLTHSKFGKNGASISATSALGSSGQNSYLSETTHSSTGNRYGIYDLVGTNYQYVAIFNISSNYNAYRYGWTGLDNNSTSTKYATKYYNNTMTTMSNYVFCKFSKVGDATKEVNRGGNISKNSSSAVTNWLDQKEKYLARVPSTGDVFLMRKGDYYSMFAASSSEGRQLNSAWSQGFRCVLCPD